MSVNNKNTAWDAIVYTDGCKKGDGGGGWSCIIDMAFMESHYVMGGYDSSTTNNKMELSGPIAALVNLEGKVRYVQIISDSQYFVNGFNSWMHGWKRRGWHRREGKLLNVEMWQHLERLKGQFKSAKAKWVRGHAGHKQNELADEIANYCYKNKERVSATYPSLSLIESAVQSFRILNNFACIPIPKMVILKQPELILEKTCPYEVLQKVQNIMAGNEQYDEYLAELVASTIEQK